MDKTELIQHWNYFCSLAERLDETKHYIDHGLIEHDGEIELVHGKVYSDVFKQIIVLAASEFEIMSKALCALHGQQVKQIVDISDAILNQYPKIITFEVSTPFWINAPLQEWRVSVVNNGNNRIVQGLDWWFAYNAIKHDEALSIQSATLQNAIMALGSLYIINLYIMHEIFGNMEIIFTFPCVYFRCKYLPHPISSGDGLLPDFGDCSPSEKFRRDCPELFR